MKPRAFYNDINEHCCDWLRRLIKVGAIPDGDVDSRSIREIQPEELRGYTQVHLFAGIGGWAYACRLAGWPDDREIWTASCPCQPFSVAGKKRGTDDERHLWPDVYRLHSARRPAVLMGEQVASPLGRNWLSGVRSDLERADNEFRGIFVPACAVSAPIERMRTWFVARPKSDGRDERRTECTTSGRELPVDRLGGPHTSALAGTSSVRERKPHDDDGPLARERSRNSSSGPRVRYSEGRDVAGASGERRAEAGPRELAPWSERDDSHCEEHSSDVASAHRWVAQFFREPGAMEGATGETQGEGHQRERRGCASGHRSEGSGPGILGSPAGVECEEREGERRDLLKELQAATGASGDFWGKSEWLQCADGKQRRLEPGVALLAYGVRPKDVAGELAGFGNAINPWVAKEIIEAWLEEFPEG